MKLHGNARTCLHSRLLIVEWVLEQRCAVAAAAEAAGVSERTAAKWLARYRREGRDGRADRSSAPRRIPRRTIAERVRVTRYECSRPGELVHVDVKKLGRFTPPATACSSAAAAASRKAPPTSKAGRLGKRV